MPSSPGSGTVLGLLALTTVNSIPVDLGAIGAPGCEAHVGTLAVTLDIVGPAGPQAVVVRLPPGMPPGARLFAQAAVLTPHVNALGMLTSNGIESTISTN